MFLTLEHRNPWQLRGVTMETFTLDPRCWTIGRVLSRNPLIRRADRIEALVMVVAFVVSLMAVPVAGVVGEVVYGVRDSRYTQEAHDRHALAATVNAVDGPDSTVVQARWSYGPAERTGAVQLAAAGKVGDRITIFVDGNGNTVAPPTPTWHAVSDAIGTIVAILLTVGFGVIFLLSAVHLRLERGRDAQWECELRRLQEDGGRKNQL
jgi:hypothetical protein